MTEKFNPHTGNTNKEKSFPKESGMGSTHTFYSNGKNYDVYKLIDYTKDVKPIRIDVKDFLSELGRQYWVDLDGNVIAPQEVLDEYNWLDKNWDNVIAIRPEWEKHIRKIIAADYLQYPVLVNDFRIIDGMHRLARAHLDGQTDIYARVVDKLPEDFVHPISK